MTPWDVFSWSAALAVASVAIFIVAACLRAAVSFWRGE